MAEIKIISENKLRYLSGLKGFNLIYLEKDYFLTLLLYLLKDIEGICFKGGTALNKIFLSHKRLSEDLDFACQKSMRSIKNQIVKILENNKNLFPKYNFENETTNFFRLKVFYKSFFTQTNFIILDINKKSSIFLQPQKQKIPHFYEGIPQFEILTLNLKELVAEKIRTLITRNQPRDYFDVYNLLKMGYKIDFRLVRKKMKEVNQKFEVKRVFKNAQKVYSRWPEITQLTNKPVEFITVIKLLQKEFKYKAT
ncbi:MAG: nucleotidyl transferase AbiEii/AbiGii toxin family protein [Candidatus Aenigmatarchaeota archaeon]